MRDIQVDIMAMLAAAVAPILSHLIRELICRYLPVAWLVRLYRSRLEPALTRIRSCRRVAKRIPCVITTRALKTETPPLTPADIRHLRRPCRLGHKESWAGPNRSGCDGHSRFAPSAS